MGEKSFYDLDYIIELNEKRLEQYNTAYQNLLGRFTNIVLIYSVMTIFMIPIARHVLSDKLHTLVYLSFFIFIILFCSSILFTIKLIIPLKIAHLEYPKIYYEENRLIYEELIHNFDEVEKLLKSSYINEIEMAIETNFTVLKVKSSLYQKALFFALFSLIPYLICSGSYLLK